MAAAWEWVQSLRRYRNRDTGELLTEAEYRRLRDTFLDRQLHRAADLAALLVAADLSVQRWELEMRDVVREVNGAMYVYGRGGRGAMTPRDWGRVGRMVRDQYGYLHDFTADVSAGKLSLAAIAARAALYVHAGVTAHARGQQAAYGGLRLPAHPGDGGTECMSRCRCVWSIEETDDEWRATWQDEGDQNECDGCRRRASAYAPYIQEKAA